MCWYIYILRCGDGTLYTGITDDVPRRLAAHRSGKGAKYTRGRGPLELVYQEKVPDKSAALRRGVLALLPPEGYPVDDYAACRALCDGPFGQAVGQADSRLADYPDGLLGGLYFAYAHAHREEFP